MFSLKSFLIPAFCTLSLSLNADSFQSLDEDRTKITYLLLDNKTLATDEDLQADPFLIVRTSHPPHEETNEQEVINDAFIRVNNGHNDFNFTTPNFFIDCDTFCEKVRWQISTSPDFSSIISSLDEITPFQSPIVLSDLQETFLDNNTLYYFRARALQNGSWGPWSNTTTFTTTKPDAIEDVYIEIDKDQTAKLVWTIADKDCYYLIFGSNSLDFTPSLYTQDISTNINDNFLGETKEAHFLLEKHFAYFRIITEYQDSYSKPSKIIPACDALLTSGQDLPRCGFDEITNLFRKKILAEQHRIQKSVSKNQAISTEYVRNPYVSEELWNALSPYFLPENSPEKATLDSIFTKRRVLSSIKSMYKSGFNLITNHNDKIIVARHPYLKGYLIKAYTDDMPYPDWYWWKKRIDGINAIQAKITASGYQGIMKTPRKWIYPLPAEPSPKVATPDRKNFILVVEEMDILDYKKNKKAYKTQMTPQILDAFYIVLSDLRLIDSVYSDNTPFCKDGRLAFVDSEHSLDTTRPVPLSNVAQYLSPEMYSYWEQLIIRGGPQR